MEEFKQRLIHLLHYPNITWKNVYQTIKTDPNLYSVYHLHPQGLPQHTFSQIPSINKSFSNSQSELVNEQIRQYKTNDISVVTIFDKQYPSLLKKIYQPPWALFAKGDLSLLEKEPMLAVIGSRQATTYGKNAIRFLFPSMIKKGIIIVSGLAKGIDTYAHESAINNGGKTIAVIAGGLYHIFPKENLHLAIEMMKTQLVVSEFPPDTKVAFSV